MLAAIAIYVNKVFDTDILAVFLQLRLGGDYRNQLLSVPGYDASYRVENLVAATKSPCASIAMGSQ